MKLQGMNSDQQSHIVLIVGLIFHTFSASLLDTLNVKVIHLTVNSFHKAHPGNVLPPLES